MRPATNRLKKCFTQVSVLFGGDFFRTRATLTRMIFGYLDIAYHCLHFLVLLGDHLKVLQMAANGQSTVVVVNTHQKSNAIMYPETVSEQAQPPTRTTNQPTRTYYLGDTPRITVHHPTANEPFIAAEASQNVPNNLRVLFKAPTQRRSKDLSL